MSPEENLIARCSKHFSLSFTPFSATEDRTKRGRLIMTARSTTLDNNSGKFPRRMSGSPDLTPSAPDTGALPPMICRMIFDQERIS